MSGRRAVAGACALAAAVIVGYRLVPAAESATPSARSERAASPDGSESSPLEPRKVAAELLASPDDAHVREGVAALTRAADRGSAEAQVALGGFLRAGHRAVPRDSAAARSLYARAAQANHPSGAYFLGTMCAAGEGGPSDASEAARWFSRAAELGSPHAMFLLANAYRAGAGVSRDDGRALALYRQAAERELPAALQTLATVYERGELGVPSDEDEARRLWMEAEHAISHPAQTP